MKHCALIILSLLLAACGGTSQATPTPDYAAVVITLERTACFGSCPIYKLTIYGGGRVEYEGERFVAVTGKQTSTISAGQVEELVKAFDAANYFSLKDEYAVQATDLPTTITSISLNGRTEMVSNYGGCWLDLPERAPQALCDLEQRID